MVGSKRPPKDAALGEMKIDAEWSVVVRRKEDPDHMGWPRLTIISTQQVLDVYKVDLRKHAFTIEFDLKRHGVWLFLVKQGTAAKGAAKKINYKKDGANQARFDFNSMAGLFKGMSTERHNVAVEVWQLRVRSATQPYLTWIYAPLRFVVPVGALKGGGLIG